MSRKSKRLAGHQFAGRKAKAAAKAVYVRPVFCDEIDTPHWDDPWWAHCDMESPHVDAPTQIPAPQPVTLLAPVPQPLLLAEWSVTTLPLRKAAVRKENDGMRIKIVEGDKFPVPLAIVRDRADYDNTQKLYQARCDAEKAYEKAGEDLITSQGFEAEMIACGHAFEVAEAVRDVTRRIWANASADAVLATRQPCPTI